MNRFVVDTMSQGVKEFLNREKEPQPELPPLPQQKQKKSIDEVGDILRQNLPVDTKNMSNFDLVDMFVSETPEMENYVDMGAINRVRGDSRVSNLKKIIDDSRQTDKNSFFRKIGNALPGQNITDHLIAKRDRIINQRSKNMSKGASLANDLTGIAKAAIADTARFAPYVITGGLSAASKIPKIFQGASKLSKLGKGAFLNTTNAGAQGVVETASRFIEELARDGDIKKSAKQAVDAGVNTTVVALALPYFLEGGVKGGKALSNSETAKNALAVGGKLVNSVSVDSTKHALAKAFQGKSIFKGKFDKNKTFHVLGKRAQDAMNYIDGVVSREVGFSRKALEKAKDKMDGGAVINKMDELIDSHALAGQTVLEKKDFKILNEIRDFFSTKKLIRVNHPSEALNLKVVKGKILDKNGKPIVTYYDEIITPKPNMSVAEMEVFRRKINNKVSSFKKAGAGETVQKPSSAGEGVLSATAKYIDDLILGLKAQDKHVQKFVDDKKTAAKIKKIRDALLPDLKDKTVERHIKNIYGEGKEEVKALFQELDELVPKNLKFIDDLKTALARSEYEKWIPGTFGGSGSGEGVNNILRAMAVASNHLLTPIFSPKLGKKGLQGISTAVKNSPKFGGFARKGLPPFVGGLTGRGDD